MLNFGGVDEETVGMITNPNQQPTSCWISELDLKRLISGYQSQTVRHLDADGNLMVFY